MTDIQAKQLAYDRAKAHLKESRFTQSMRWGLQQAVRKFWRDGDALAFASRFTDVFSEGIRRAWEEGAAECGIRREELTLDEQQAMRTFIASNLNYLGGLISAIAEGRDAGTRTLSQMLDRVELWVNRYAAAQVKAAAMACGNKKKMWILGGTKEHCSTCSRFNGRVYRYSVWLENNALPKQDCLECGGFNCKCELVDTDERITPGRFPKSALAC